MRESTSQLWAVKLGSAPWGYARDMTLPIRLKKSPVERPVASILHWRLYLCCKSRNERHSTYWWFDSKTPIVQHRVSKTQDLDVLVGHPLMQVVERQNVDLGNPLCILMSNPQPAHDCFERFVHQ